MPDFRSRTAMLVGTEALDRLAASKVAIFGLGGVGGSAVEALARAGVGSFVLIDGDDVAESNLNRQTVALRSTLCLAKTEAMERRIHDINPEANVELISRFITPDDPLNMLCGVDAVIDAIDTVSVKLNIAKRCFDENIPLVAAMGCGNRLHPEKLVITDIFKTSGCGLCRVMRHELRKRGVTALRVVASTEEAISPSECGENTGRRSTPGSSPFVPPAAGLLLASDIFNILTERK